MEGQFKDKVALVTGGGSGIGRASAIAFSREGAKVVVSDFREEPGRDTVEFINRSGGEAVFIKADISKTVEVEQLNTSSNRNCRNRIP